MRTRTGPLLLGVPFLTLLLCDGVAAQTMALMGQRLFPAFEGWEQQEDGSVRLWFGYYNENWEQEFDLPVGPDNYFTTVEVGADPSLDPDDAFDAPYDPAQADQGQPTHFLPRRNPFLFTITVPEPEEFGGPEERQIVWTLNANGKTQRVYASLSPNYAIDGQAMSTDVGGNHGSTHQDLRTNVPPKLEVEGPRERRARVGEPVSLVALADDPDDYPPRRERQRPESLEDLYDPPSGSVVRSAPGLRLSWIVYRGPADHATFRPTQMKTWMDSRMYANSPWSPPYILPEPPEDGSWVAEVTFAEPGEYVLRAVASDGARFSYENVRVVVTR
ncbi:MAG TPA: hypothetical protein VMM35_01395 [Longimicrobiales bacterium]|nr:hypothetical protein [Longimicrobiales bacterium]